ncbi:MAG: prepilin-type N-terminal cleavage/methylation domain-containing protein [Fimbriimonadaceae bacterium]|nr:prepilin-type N-terminal cleavage/methylation domain-containing protein [Fimbriimonadaceae bacterium]
MKTRSAFTLIELLVVIAIIAILAAILFPVFAQAKAAAKKTQDLSHIKQLATGTMIYTSDYDDTFPLAYAVSSTGFWYTTFLIETPADWPAGFSQAYYDENRTHVLNSTFPYTKNGEMLKSTAGVDRTIAGANYNNRNRAFFTTNYQFNGTLNSWSATAVNQPSQLPMYSQNRGTMNIRGFGTSNPFLQCPNSGQPCVFQPSSPTCSPFGSGRNGQWSEMLFNSTYTQWVHGRGQIVVHADTSTKWRSMNGPVNGRSDFRTMYWTRFRSNGASINEWQDTNFCHTMLFQPDFDFSTFGSPIEY